MIEIVILLGMLLAVCTCAISCIKIIIDDIIYVMPSTSFKIFAKTSRYLYPERKPESIGESRLNFLRLLALKHR